MSHTTPTKPSRRFQSLRDGNLFQSRMSAVESASTALQSAMGVTPIAQKRGRIPIVEVWEFPLPLPSTLAPHTGGHAEMSSSSGDEEMVDADVESSDSDTFWNPPIPASPSALPASAAPQTPPAKPLAERESALSSATIPHSAPVDELDITLIDTTAPSPRAENARAPSPSPVEPYTLSLPPPPPSLPSRDGETPLYWSPSLPATFSAWRTHPSCERRATALNRAILRSTSSESARLAFDTGVSFEEENIYVARITLTTFRMPSAAVAGDDTLLQWVVISVLCGEDATIFAEDSSKEGVTNGPRGFMLAVPVDAVTAVRRDVLEEDEEVVVTEVTLGVPGRLPVMGGMGVRRKFAEGFMRACAAGRGVLLLESESEMQLGV